MILNLSQITELKQQLSEQFGVYLHLHDTCGAQYFSFDAPVSMEVQDYIIEFVHQYGALAQFSEDQTGLFIK